MIGSRTLLLLLAAASITVPNCALAAIGDQLTRLPLNDVTSFPYFGDSVAIDGERAIVGSPGDDNVYQDGGSVYLFNVDSGQLITKLLPNDGSGLDRFGGSVALAGNLAVIGAADDNDGRGAAYVFDINTQTQIRKLVPSDPARNDFFGGAVAISGTTAVIGAGGDDDQGTSSGSAYLFDITTGNQVAKLLPNDGFGSSFFGGSVGISGNTAIVGANSASNGIKTDSGSVYLFDVTTGNQIAKLLPDDGASFDFFGDSVAISGNIAVVGAPNDDDLGLQSGSAYLFNVTTGEQIAKIVPSDGAAGDEFGSSVAISGRTAIIGARGDNEPFTDRGSAYLFDIQTFNQLAKLVADDGATDDRFGNSVSISGNRAVIGAYNKDHISSGTGAAYLFDATNPVPEPNVLASVAAAILGGLSIRHCRPAR